MKRYLIFLLVSLSAVSLKAQDLIILRSGEEYEGKVIQASQNSVLIESKTGGLFSKGTHRSTLNPSDIYLIKYKGRGNVYFKDNGARISGENQKIDRSADIIYLKEGKEIPAWNLSFDTETITFRSSKENKKARSSNASVKTADVFMIKYSDGSKDVMNDLSSGQKTANPQSASSNDKTGTKYKVIFHTVKSGDTLSSIATKYNVRIEDLRTWNEIEPHVRSNARLKPGTEYIIQQIITP